MPSTTAQPKTKRPTMLEHGYEIVKADDIQPLIELREKVFKKAQELVGKKGKDAESFLDNFHDLGLEGAKLNEVRVKLVEYGTANLGTGKAIYKAFNGYLTNLLGPDVAVQKTTNLVIQQPGDPDQVPVHRDAPLNSPFEVVVWLPLVHCYGTKGMYVLDMKDSAEAVKILGRKDPQYSDYKDFAEKRGAALDVPFGSAAFFWTGLVHGCHVNGEGETRWSLNIRYKNLFSPYGSKFLGDFFEVLNLSPLAKAAFKYEKENAK